MTNSPSRNRISILLFNLFFLLLLPRSLSDDTGVVGHDGQHFFGFFFASFLSLRWRRSSKSNRERERERERESGWRWSHPTGSSKGPGPWNPRTATLSFDFLVCGFLGSLFCFRFFFLSFVPPLLERREHEPPMGGGGPVVPAFQRSSSLSEPPQTRPGDGFLCVRSFSFEAKKNRKNLRRKRIFLFFFVNFFLFFFCFFYPTRPVHSTLIAPLISLFFISLDDLVFFDFFSFFFFVTSCLFTS